MTEQQAKNDERDAIVEWLAKEAVDAKAYCERFPSENAIMILQRALYYQQASGFISRNEHRKGKP